MSDERMEGRTESRRSRQSRPALWFLALGGLLFLGGAMTARLDADRAWILLGLALLMVLEALFLWWSNRVPADGYRFGVRHQASRRWILAFAAASLAAGLLLYLFGGYAAREGAILFTFPPLVVLCWFAFGTPFRVVRRRGELDERQRALLHRAYDVSYRIVGVAIGLYLVTHFWLIDPARFPGLPPQHARNLAINLYVMLPFLPAAVIGWIEPDLPEERRARLGRTVRHHRHERSSQRCGPFGGRRYPKPPCILRPFALDSAGRAPRGRHLVSHARSNRSFRSAGFPRAAPLRHRPRLSDRRPHRGGGARQEQGGGALGPRLAALLRLAQPAALVADRHRARRARASHVRRHGRPPHPRARASGRAAPSPGAGCGGSPSRPPAPSSRRRSWAASPCSSSCRRRSRSPMPGSPSSSSAW